MNNNHWGRTATPLEVRYDPLQSFLENGQPVGFRVHIVPDRRSRPRENLLPSFRSKESSTEHKPQKSILTAIIRGEELSIPISGDKTIIGDFYDQPKNHNLEQFKGITVLNKYSPLDVDGPSAKGIALVSIPVKYTENLDKAEPIEYLLVSLQTAVKYFLTSEKFSHRFSSSLIFFNIGPSSGASLRHLHAQTYILPFNSGLVSYAFNRSFKQYTDCFICKMANSDHLLDKLNQELRIKDRTLWEDDHVRLIVPHAPIRAMSLRILLKNHISWIGEFTKEITSSVAYALSLAHNTIQQTDVLGKRLKSDRTVGFRQSVDLGSDFHMFIDLLPAIPFGGAEIIDSLSILTFTPERLAIHLRKVIAGL
ncbi:MAG: hypothetical protein ACXAD7_09585 [Candidatus Kariarchaeaceae archaeon]|jgi:galactose-1-phosphate uridylyltransferase